jgi:hypothetical protein
VSEQVVDLVLPRECVLTIKERDIVFNTLLPDEIPCAGCFRVRECRAGTTSGISIAKGMGIASEDIGVKCGRCGGVALGWFISGAFRVWRCTRIIENEVRGASIKFKARCDWEKADLGAPIE